MVNGRPSLNTFHARAAQISTVPDIAGMVLGFPNSRCGRRCPQALDALRERLWPLRVDARSESESLGLQLAPAAVQGLDQLAPAGGVLLHPVGEDGEVVVLAETVRQGVG